MPTKSKKIVHPKTKQLNNGSPVFKTYEKEVLATAKKINKRIEKEKKTKKYFDGNNYPIEKIKNEIQKTVQNVLNISSLDAEQIELDVPPPQIPADFSLNIFPIAKKISSGNPNELAKKIAEAINSSNSTYIQKSEIAGPFVNIKIKQDIVYSETLSNIFSLKDKYGESNTNEGKIALFDYSAPNIAKPIGVGHLRSTIIGQSLANIYEKTGFSVIKDNHLGDWGTQFGELIYAYENWGDVKKIAKNPIYELKELYVLFHKKVSENPELKERARELFNRLEQKDSALIKLWKKFRDLSIKDFKKTYKQLEINFDSYIGESYFAGQVDAAIEDCLKNNVAKKDKETNLVIVDCLNGLPSFLLRKQDGTSLYLTRDLAALKFRIKNFQPDSIIYVVGNEQELNFRQLFALAKAINYLPEKTELKHISFGMILSDGKKMSTRKGTLVELGDLIKESVEKSREILLKKNPSLKSAELKNISEIIGIGAIIYNDLRQSKTKNISFDWERMLNFESGSAAYLQYTCTRINSILKKINPPAGGPENNFKASFENEKEFELAKKLMLFPLIVNKSQKTDSPHLIATYLEETAQLFNAFYHEVSIIQTKSLLLQKSRIGLIQSTLSVIKNGLALLNIKVPRRM
jgi:arginyl-tRNA synthetase